jgi:hypothetical protein
MIQVLKKKVELEEAKLALLKHKTDIEVENLLDDELNKNTLTNSGMFLTNEQLHKLLSYLEHTITDNENIDIVGKHNLSAFREDLSWDIADHLAFNLNEGTVEPIDFKFKTY